MEIARMKIELRGGGGGGVVCWFIVSSSGASACLLADLEAECWWLGSVLIAWSDHQRVLRDCVRRDLCGI